MSGQEMRPVPDDYSTPYRPRCHARGHLGEGTEMELVASTMTGWDTLNIWECPACGRGLTLQMAPAAGGLPPVVRLALPTGVARHV